MNGQNRRHGFRPTTEGLKKLKEAKETKKYTYQQIAIEAKETENKVKRLFHPKNVKGAYGVSENAVQAICNVLNLKPKEIISNWNDEEIFEKEHGEAYYRALEIIEEAKKNNAIELDLSKMQLRELPAEIGQLSNLTKLNLSRNYLSCLPKEIGQLSNLTSLELSYTSLKDLPKEIGQLFNLISLDLSYNLLKGLPKEIVRLSSLKQLYLYSNSLNDLPPEIRTRSYDRKVILNYYSWLLNDREKPLHEAKRLIVGQANVGKTCLLKRLIDNTYNPSRNKTDGIDIHNWEIEVEDKELQVNIWDFGGQEIYHATHQFFLTKRSLYLLVTDTTLTDEENRIEYWLKIIKTFGEDSPVVIVGNKGDQHPLDIDKNGLRYKYPQILSFWEVSCETGAGIPELNEYIQQQISQLDHVNDVLPLSWFNIKEQLEQLDKDYIPYDRYEEICEDEGIKEDDIQRTLIGLLHDLGIVLNFQDDIRLADTHVLNPEWVTNGVYKILNDRQIMMDDGGILKVENLKRILNRRRYPIGKHSFIIGMMRKFELCFDVEVDKQLLIPDLLPKEELETGDWHRTLAFEYHYPVLPSSILSRFIVRMSHLIHENTCWRTGVVLAMENNQALIKADREEKLILIRVRGQENTRRNLLTAIRSQFAYIHSTIPGIVPVEKVPLIDHPQILFNYKNLLGLEKMGEEYIGVGELGIRVPLNELLGGIDYLPKIDKHNIDRYQSRMGNNSPVNVNVINNFSANNNNQNQIQNHSGGGDNVGNDKNIKNEYSLI